MSRIWAVARHTISESLRMKIALVFLLLLAMVVLGLPFSIQGDNSLTGRVQSFLSYGLSATSALLGILTVFMSRTLSDELVNKQIQIVMTKPLPRWQFVSGKWLGIVTLNATFLLFSMLAIYGMVHYIKFAYSPIDELDEAALNNEVLAARHGKQFTPPDFVRMAERAFEQRVEDGYYVNVQELDTKAEIARLHSQLDAQWRVVGYGDRRMFTFENLLCDRSPGKYIHVRYKAEVFSPPADEILRSRWVFGDPAKGTNIVVKDTRHIVGRFHTIRVPADTIADDHTLTAMFINENPFPGTLSSRPGMQFRKTDGVEALFVVGSFEGNLFRAGVLIQCKLMFLAALALVWTALLSFPVACLTTFVLYALCAGRSFIEEGIDFSGAAVASFRMTVSDFFGALVQFDTQTLFTKLQELVTILMAWMMGVVGYVLPDFSYYDSVETLVAGRNVTLMWVLEGVGKLGGLQTFALLGLAILIFQMREVAETSA